MSALHLAAGVLAFAGGCFVLLAGVGVVRLPDVLTRMHAATKAGTLGVALVAAASALLLGGVAPMATAGLIVLLLVLTNPAASHLLGRAAYLSDAPRWERTVTDELAGRYDRDRRRLESGPRATPPAKHPG